VCVQEKESVCMSERSRVSKKQRKEARALAREREREKALGCNMFAREGL